MNKNIKCILINGFARSGKDTLLSLLQSINPDIFERYAFADALKCELSNFIEESFGWDIFNLTNKQKEILRPIMISFGCAKREIDINYWVKNVYNDIHDDLKYMEKSGTIPVITDCRFISEYHYMQKAFKNQCLLVNVTRNGVPTPPDEELKNQPDFEKYIDFKIVWNTVGDGNLKKLLPYVEKFYNKYFN